MQLLNSRCAWWCIGLLGLTALGTVALAESQVGGPAAAPQYNPGTSNSVTYNVTVTDSDDDDPDGNGGDAKANQYTITTYVCSSNSANVKATVSASQSVTQGGDQPGGNGRPSSDNPTTVAVTVTIPASTTGSPTIVIYTRAASPEDPKPKNPKKPRGTRECVSITPTAG